MSRTPQLSREVLEAALAGLEGQRDRIEAQIAEVRARLAVDALRSQAQTPALPRQRQFAASVR